MLKKHQQENKKDKITLKKVAQVFLGNVRKLVNKKSITTRGNNKRRVASCHWCFGSEDSSHVSLVMDKYYKALCVKEVTFLERKTMPQMIICKITRKLVSVSSNSVTTTRDKVCIYRYESDTKRIKLSHYEYCLTTWSADGLPDKITINADKSLYESCAGSVSHLFAQPIASSNAKAFLYGASLVDHKVGYAHEMPNDILSKVVNTPTTISSEKSIKVSSPNVQSSKRRKKKPLASQQALPTSPTVKTDSKSMEFDFGECLPEIEVV